MKRPTKHERLLARLEKVAQQFVLEYSLSETVYEVARANKRFKRTAARVLREAARGGK
jgi:hypothetical protein